MHAHGALRLVEFCLLHSNPYTVGQCHESDTGLRVGNLSRQVPDEIKRYTLHHLLLLLLLLLIVIVIHGLFIIVFHGGVSLAFLV